MTDSKYVEAGVSISEDGTLLVCSGDWTVSGIGALESSYHALMTRFKDVAKIDVSQVSQIDSAGALLLASIAKEYSAGREERINVQGIKKQSQTLYQLITQTINEPVPEALSFKTFNPLYRVGKKAFNKYQHFMCFMAFIGELALQIYYRILHPSRINWRAILYTVQDSGYNATPIIAFMSFLIGIVLAYQLGSELESYGANIFVVNIIGIAAFREFGPLITAIILAGRTSTAFAALIGTMKVNEEIDALRTMGLSPMDRLVVPRILGLIIVMPLLIVWSDIFIILGGMVMAKGMGINYVAFLDRLQAEVSISNYILGLAKAPTFALIISGVGCFQGLMTELNADSIGKNTTRAAVLTIFLIIIADAIYSLIYSFSGV